MGWTEYVAAPIVLDGRAIGFLHADRRPSGRAVDDGDAEALSTFALCFALVYERALLRHRLRVQRDEMRQVAAWADARTSELGDRSITLAADAESEGEAPAIRRNGAADSALRDLLTRRELDVLELMVRGDTNAGIAKELVVSEGTVKFHVKNILRKLHANNRAEATSRYLRMTLRGRRGALTLDDPLPGPVQVDGGGGDGHGAGGAARHSASARSVGATTTAREPRSTATIDAPVARTASSAARGPASAITA